MDESIKGKEQTFDNLREEDDVETKEQKDALWENPVEEAFSLNGQDIRTYSPPALAFIGDGVFELIVRTLVVERGNTHAGLLHKRCSQLVNAKTQAAMAEKLLPLLSEEELAVYKRGRNAKVGTRSRSASPADYKKATGFEALIGYLYLEHEMGRILELVGIALEGL